MVKPIQVKALPNYKLWLKYADGVEGEVDLAHLAGKGVFALWNDYRVIQAPTKSNSRLHPPQFNLFQRLQTIL